jgi:hypothetical protein
MLTRPKWWAATASYCLLLALLGALPGCSLISLKSPEKPLSQRDLNARLLTREYSDRFQKVVAGTADDIATGSSEQDVQLAALRWKIGAASASRHAATQLSPMMGLLDTWALSAQMQAFLADGAGSQVFGPQQEAARLTAAQLLQDIVAIARQLDTADEFSKYQQFVTDYVQAAPLTSLAFVRDSVVDRWTASTGQRATLISTVGTVPEVMSDFADRLRLYGDELPSGTLWQTQLALREAGYGTLQWRQAIGRMNDSLGDIGNLANQSPELLRGSVNDLRDIMYGAEGRLDHSWMQMMRATDAEREAFAHDVGQERVSIAAAVDLQRAALTQDAERIIDRVTDTAWRQLHRLVGEIALAALALIAVLLGLPFAAGYFVGRARASRSA